VLKSPAIANFQKLDWFNEQHIRSRAASGDAQLLTEAKELVWNKFGKSWSEQYIEKVVDVMKVCQGLHPYQLTSFRKEFAPSKMSVHFVNISLKIQR
jgi:glutamyl/glutaminyl-tRNA synthetase